MKDEPKIFTCLICTHFDLGNQSSCDTCGDDVRISCSKGYFDVGAWAVEAANEYILRAPSCKDFKSAK